MIIPTLKRFAVLFLIAPTLLAAGQETPCVQVRAAFDVGSVSTKMKVARVDKCQKKVLESLLEEGIKSDYKTDFELNGKKNLSSASRERGLAVILELKKKAETAGATAFSGSATEIFREATEGPAFISEVREKTGVNLRVVPQTEEGRLGFLAAASASGLDPSKIVSWDIGGASMQLTQQTAPDKLEVYEGKTASVSFMKQIVEKIEKKDFSKTQSPNPMGPKNALSAAALAKKASKEVPASFRKKIAQPKTEVIAVGPVHYSSIADKSLGKVSFYTQENLRASLIKQSTLTDEQVGGKYASTDISNLALVLGFMQGLGIKKVRVFKINLTDGILNTEEFWK